jgi:ubiquinone/menaquinone biosynthesis C-methylase UbiE
VQLLARALVSADGKVSTGDDPGQRPETASSDTAAPAEVRPAVTGAIDVLDRLRCPTCRADVHVVPEIVTADGRIKRGHVPCDTCREVVASIRDFRVDFRARQKAVPPQGRPPRTIPVLGESRMPHDDSRLVSTGDWTPWDGRFLVSRGSIGDSLEYRGLFTDALVHLVTHASGGVVDFFVDDTHTGTVDLHSEYWFVLPFTIASDLPAAEHVLRIQPRGTMSSKASGAEVFVSELVLLGPRTEPGFEEPRAIIRGNPYMEPFERCITQTPADELVLEVGGGERRRMRPGYINLEYLSLEFADIYGDIHQLPFRDDTFGLVLAQAVFEHVSDPFTAASELVRVTRPDGLIVVDVAFMQPLHAAPYHYFNMTPWGIGELFKSCTIVETDHYDGFASTIDWILRSAGAHSTVTSAEYEDVIERIRRMEVKLSHTDIRPAASGYYIIGRKTTAGASTTVTAAMPELVANAAVSSGDRSAE